VYPDFVEMLKAAIEGIPSAGDAVTRQSAEHAYDLLLDAQEKGAKFLVGGPEYLSETSLKPTLITNVSQDARIRDEETFEPSASVYLAEDDDDAIMQANDSAYGLNCAVHSTSWEHAYNVAKQLEYGQVHINSMTTGDSREFQVILRQFFMLTYTQPAPRFAVSKARDGGSQTPSGASMNLAWRRHW
jgi:acyl-CoA reductase-like NAD-dependent aldehyde dehydrogenase